MSVAFNEPANEVQEQVKKSIEDFVQKKLNDKMITIPIYQHTHLRLGDPESFSTSYEGVYFDGDYLMEVVSNAINDGEIKLPSGYDFDMYSSVEMYFYKA